MHLLRRGSGVVWLAVFALIGQLVLSLGHFHSQRRTSDGIAASLPDDRGGRLVSPGDVPGEGTDEDDCAICQTIAIARALVLPESVSVPFPLGQFVNGPALGTVRNLERQAASFQARAPPFSSLI